MADKALRVLGHLALGHEEKAYGVWGVTEDSTLYGGGLSPQLLAVGATFRIVASALLAYLGMAAWLLAARWRQGTLPQTRHLANGFSLVLAFACLQVMTSVVGLNPVAAVVPGTASLPDLSVFVVLPWFVAAMILVFRPRAISKPGRHRSLKGLLVALIGVSYALRLPTGYGLYYFGVVNDGALDAFPFRLHLPEFGPVAMSAANAWIATEMVLVGIAMIVRWQQPRNYGRALGLVGAATLMHLWLLGNQFYFLLRHPENTLVDVDASWFSGTSPPIVAANAVLLLTLVLALVATIREIYARTIIGKSTARKN